MERAWSREIARSRQGDRTEMAAKVRPPSPFSLPPPSLSFLAQDLLLVVLA